MQHSPGFLKLVGAASRSVSEISVAEARARLAVPPAPVLLDVRELDEWQAGHAAGAVHLSRGILERDLERTFPDPATEIILYCGGGYRSVLACEAAQKMGYRRVASIIGGYKAMLAAGWECSGGPKSNILS